VAANILENLTVRWSSARILNDPFDVQLKLRFDFDSSQLHDKLIEQLEQAVFGEQEPKGDPGRAATALIKTFRTQRASLPRDVFKGLRPVLEFTAPSAKQALKEVNEVLARSNANLKLFCVAEKHDNLLMWAHYSKDHTGAVVKLRCLPELKSSLCFAIPVTYQEDLPVVAELETWAEQINGLVVPQEGDALFKRFACTKSKDWEYEREWRAFAAVDREDGDGFAYRGLYPEEIEAVYLGCRMNEETRGQIIEAVRGKVPHVQLYQAQKSETRFALEFVPL